MTLDVSLRHRLGRFDLDVAFAASGRVTALFGRSGAGKSTVVALVAGLGRAREGRIAVDGRTLFDSASRLDVPAHRRRVGLVFQDARLFPHLSVRANLTFGRWAGRRRAGRDRFDETVALLGLDHLLDRRPRNLSGGEAQRVAIGRALLSDPAILLMDEPLASLDGQRRTEVLPFLDRLARDGGVPILYVSHAIDEVARLADHLVVLSEGRVVASGEIADVLARIDLGPATGRHEAGALLQASIADHDGTNALTRLLLDGSGQAVLVPRIPGLPGDAVRLRIRARDVALALQPVSGLSIRNALPATIVGIAEEAGAFAEILLDCGGQRLRARITRLAAQELELTEGLPVIALLKSVAVDRQAVSPA